MVSIKFQFQENVKRGRYTRMDFLILTFKSPQLHQNTRWLKFEINQRLLDLCSLPFPFSQDRKSSVSPFPSNQFCLLPIVNLIRQVKQFRKHKKVVRRTSIFLFVDLVVIIWSRGGQNLVQMKINSHCTFLPKYTLTRFDQTWTFYNIVNSVKSQEPNITKHKTCTILPK